MFLANHIADLLNQLYLFCMLIQIHGNWKLKNFTWSKKSVATTVTRKVKVTLIGLLGHGTLKSAVSWEWIDEIADFLHTDTNLRKLKVT